MHFVLILFIARSSARVRAVLRARATEVAIFFTGDTMSFTLDPDAGWFESKVPITNNTIQTHCWAEAYDTILTTERKSHNETAIANFKTTLQR